MLLHVQVVKRNQNMVYVDVKLQFYTVGEKYTKHVIEEF